MLKTCVIALLAIGMSIGLAQAKGHMHKIPGCSLVAPAAARHSSRGRRDEGEAGHRITIATQRPDLILMDIQLPSMDGHGTMRRPGGTNLVGLATHVIGLAPMREVGQQVVRTNGSRRQVGA